MAHEQIRLASRNPIHRLPPMLLEPPSSDYFERLNDFQEIRKHLFSVLGADCVYSCHNREVFYPAEGAVFTVAEPIRILDRRIDHESGEEIDQLVPGTYRVLSVLHYGFEGFGMTCWMKLARVNQDGCKPLPVDIKVVSTTFDGHIHCVDWRGIESSPSKSERCGSVKKKFQGKE